MIPTQVFLRRVCNEKDEICVLAVNDILKQEKEVMQKKDIVLSGKASTVKKEKNKNR